MEHGSNARQRRKSINGLVKIGFKILILKTSKLQIPKSGTSGKAWGK